jgi:hypothetical protein
MASLTYSLILTIAHRFATSSKSTGVLGVASSGTRPLASSPNVYGNPCLFQPNLSTCNQQHRSVPLACANHLILVHPRSTRPCHSLLSGPCIIFRASSSLGEEVCLGRASRASLEGPPRSLGTLCCIDAHRCLLDPSCLLPRRCRSDPSLACLVLPSPCALRC